MIPTHDGFGRPFLSRTQVRARLSDSRIRAKYCRGDSRHQQDAAGRFVDEKFAQNKLGDAAGARSLLRTASSPVGSDFRAGSSQALSLRSGNPAVRTFR